jgi:hypothetical protein
MLENQKLFWTSIHSTQQSQFYLSGQHHRFQYFGHYTQIWKKRYFNSKRGRNGYGDPVPDRQALDTDPDPTKLCRSEQIQIYKTARAFY